MDRSTYVSCRNFSTFSHTVSKINNINFVKKGTICSSIKVTREKKRKFPKKNDVKYSICRDLFNLTFRICKRVTRNRRWWGRALNVNLPDWHKIWGGLKNTHMVHSQDFFDRNWRKRATRFFLSPIDHKSF